MKEAFKDAYISRRLSIVSIQESNVIMLQEAFVLSMSFVTENS
jgi:hypothetical protein